MQPQFAKMVQLIDIFAKPMICLLRELVQWFEDQNIKVTPESIFADVQDSIDIAHPLFHQIVKEDPARFLDNRDISHSFIVRHVILVTGRLNRR